MLTAYEHVPGYPFVFLLVAAASLYFLLATLRHVRVFALAGPARPFGSAWSRIGSLVRYALAQVKMFQDPRPGLMHFAIFWGFVCLAIGPADILTGGLVAAVLSWPLDGTIWAMVGLLQNLVAFVVLVAIAYAAWRRLVTRPARLTLSRGALVILGLISGVVGAEVLAMGFEAALLGDRPGAVITNALAIPLRRLDETTIQAGFALAWWVHMVLIAAFICYLPGSKHLHIVTSFPNVYLHKQTPQGELAPMDLGREDQPFGARAIADLTWKDLLDGFTCTECGRCTASCPANLTGKVLNPKEMIMGIRQMVVNAEVGMPLLPPARSAATIVAADRERAAEALAKPVLGGAISYEAVWDCTTCGACFEACPVLIEHVDKIVALRRNLVLEDARFPAELTKTFRNLERTGNPWGQPASGRLAWTKGLPIAVPTVAELAAGGDLASLEVLYWVGCAAAFDERSMKIARAVVTCLAAAGVRFAVLGPEETCTGDPARRCGNEHLYQQLAKANIETLTRYGLAQRTIITACPHCMNTIGTEYRQLSGHFTVLHHAVYLRRLLAEDRLRIVTDGPTASVTLHDSCYLARHHGVVAEPREILRALPMLEMREMEKSGRSTFCCGGGGGRMWMMETVGTRINVERARQVAATGAGAVVTECPFCMTMLRDGLAAAGDGSADIEAIDLAELLAERLAASTNDL